MLRTTSGLSRPVLTWVSQLTASLGATLAATLIWSTVPHPTASPAMQPEMTSGGKFAARAMDAVAFDGLDTMPLPRVAPLAAVPVLAEGAYRTVSDGRASLTLAPDRPVHAARPAHAAGRRAPAVEPSERAATVAPASVEAAPEPAGEGGFLNHTMPRILPTITSAARDAWAVTALSGEALVSRVVPQIP